MTIAKAVARAWHDAAYKAKLLHDPHAALREEGVSVPEGATVKVLENDDDVHHVVLPKAPSNTGRMSRQDLEELATMMMMRGNIM